MNPTVLLRTAREFIRYLRDHGLLDNPGLDYFLEQHPTYPDAPADVARLMVQDGLLSHDLAEQLLPGQWKGTTIGRYRLLKKLGAVRTSSTFLCEDTEVCRRVVIRILFGIWFTNHHRWRTPDQLFSAIASFPHPHLPRVYGMERNSEGKLCLLVTEFVSGRNLQEIVHEHCPLPVAQAAGYVRQVAVALKHAHDKIELNHHCIIPHDLLVTPTDTIKVTELGLSNLEQNRIARWEDSPTGLRIIDFRSPELLMEPSSFDPRADIYSLGCLFYFLLTGQPPFATGNIFEKMMAHQTHDFPPIHFLRPDIPQQMELILKRMTVKQPEYRYQTFGSLIDAVDTLPALVEYGHCRKREARWPADVTALAAAMVQWEDCAFALHDALLEHGHAEAARHFETPGKHHGADCWLAKQIVDEG